MSNRKSRPGRTLAMCLLAGTAVGGLALAGLPMGAHAQSDPGVVQPKPGAIEPGQISHPLPDFVGLVRQVKPAVVSITSKMHPDEDEESQGSGGGMPGFGHGQGFPFGFPFAMPQQQQRQRLVEARGSGFLIDANGTIVTNNHVVRGATSVSVTLDDGSVLPARVIGRDKASDLAVLRVKANHPLPFINLGDSNAAQPGAWVVAVGNPFGLGGTVTAGIVSARGRDIGEGNYDSFLQIDAPSTRAIRAVRCSPRTAGGGRQQRHHLAQRRRQRRHRLRHPVQHGQERGGPAGAVRPRHPRLYRRAGAGGERRDVRRAASACRAPTSMVRWWRAWRPMVRPAMPV